jgi:competence protein ComEA
MELSLGRSPQLVAAAACFLLGSAVLALGLWPGLGRPTAPPSIVDDFDGFAELAEPAPAAPIELIVYVTGAVPRPDVYRLPAGARVKDAVLAAGGLRSDAAAEQVNLAAPLNDAGHVHIPALSEAPPLGEAPTSGGPALLDLNRASASALEDLPGVGQVLAERIIARRDEQGPFKQIEDLRTVTGIGDKLYAQLAPLVTVGP